MKSILTISLVTSTLLIGVTKVQAAALQGLVGINPPTPALGDPATGAILTGTTSIHPNGEPLPDIDFVPPQGGGIGGVVEINANPLSTGENDFLPFVGFAGDIKDVTASDLLALPSTPIPDFITIDNPTDTFSFTLREAIPEVHDGSLTIEVSGTFFNLDDGSMDPSDGVGVFTFDFPGSSEGEIRSLLSNPGVISTFNPGTWSSSFVVTADAEPTVTPEASNILGLLAIGSLCCTSLTRRKFPMK